MTHDEILKQYIEIFGEPEKITGIASNKEYYFNSFHFKYGLTLMIHDGEVNTWFWPNSITKILSSKAQYIEEILDDCSDELRDKLLFNLDLFI